MTPSVKRTICRGADLIAAPFVLPAGLLLKMVRRVGVHQTPISKKVLMTVGVFPIRAHYYEPQFNVRMSDEDAARDRHLPGIDWNIDGQLESLGQLRYGEELARISDRPGSELEFHFGNGAFESGDAEFWYQVVRWKKPKRIFEIGSGFSTLMGIRAVQKNKEECPGYKCRHVCIEPYERPWLERTGLEIVRHKVECVDVSLFRELEADDILFIDSSHMIRPEGDVLFEYLQILPTLAPGVIVHIHDILSPRNYLKNWLQDEVRFWNEQYLLEAYLSENPRWRIFGALNFLHHHFPERLKAVAPYVKPDREPVSFYIQRVS